jgi:hypothetical protein
MGAGKKGGGGARPGGSSSPWAHLAIFDWIFILYQGISGLHRRLKMHAIIKTLFIAGSLMTPTLLLADPTYFGQSTISIQSIDLKNNKISWAGVLQSYDTGSLMTSYSQMSQVAFSYPITIDQKGKRTVIRNANDFAAWINSSFADKLHASCSVQGIVYGDDNTLYINIGK